MASLGGLGRTAATLGMALTLSAAWGAGYDHLYDYDPAALQFGVRTADREGRVLEVSFDSLVPSEWPSNQRVRCLYYPARGGVPGAAVVVLHVLGTREARMEQSLCRYLAAHGIGAVLMPLPYHMSRTPPGQRSGDLFLQPSPQAIREALRQSVVDCRCLVEFLSQRPEVRTGQIGAVGLSLGGIVALLAGQVEGRLSAVVAVAGAGYPAEVVWTSEIVPDLRENLVRQGVTRERLAQVLAGVNACELPAANPQRRLLMIMARHDSFVPTALQEQTWVALGRPAAVRLSAGHLTAFARPERLWREVSAFLATTWAGEPYTPRAWWVPTAEAGVLGGSGWTPTLGILLKLTPLDHRERLSVELGYTGHGGLVGLGYQAGRGLTVGVGSPLTRDFGRLGLYWLVGLTF